MPDEIHSVFPDPAGRPTEPHAPGSAGPAPRSVEQWINHAYDDIDKHSLWDIRDGSIYCLICLPGGYRLKRNADPNTHATQRNPDKHVRNLRWAVVQWFRAHDMPLPSWPDAYRRSIRDGQLLFCHICRLTVGIYGEEDGLTHDATHLTMRQEPMRPNRLIEPTVAQRRAIKPHKQNALDAFLTAQREGAEVTRQTPDYDEPGNWNRPGGLYDTNKFNTPPRPSPQFDPVEMPSMTPGPVEDRAFMTDPSTGKPVPRTVHIEDEEVMVPTLLELAPPHPGSDELWSIGCAKYEQHDFDPPQPSVVWPCKVVGCQCNCHTRHSAPEQTVGEPSA